ncbi:MAG: hypothetical protein QXF76_00145 [Candidatus Anstonellales archaeon]
MDDKKLEEFIEFVEEEKKEVKNSDDIEKKINEVYLKKVDIQVQQNNPNVAITNQQQNQQTQEKEKHWKFRILISLFGLLGILLIVYFFVPDSTKNFFNNEVNQNLEIKKNEQPNQKTTNNNKEIIEYELTTYSKAIGNEAKVGFANYYYDEHMQTVIGKFVTSYQFKIVNITTLNSEVKGDKVINIYFNVTNLASEEGDKKQLVLIRDNGEIYYSSCDYTTKPRIIKNVKCTFFVPSVEGFTHIGILKEYGLEKEGIEKMFKLV